MNWESLLQSEVLGLNPLQRRQFDQPIVPGSNLTSEIFDSLCFINLKEIINELRLSSFIVTPMRKAASWIHNLWFSSTTTPTTSITLFFVFAFPILVLIFLLFWSIHYLLIVKSWLRMGSIHHLISTLMRRPKLDIHSVLHFEYFFLFLPVVMVSLGLLVEIILTFPLRHYELILLLHMVPLAFWLRQCFRLVFFWTVLWLLIKIKLLLRRLITSDFLSFGTLLDFLMGAPRLVSTKLRFIATWYSWSRKYLRLHI